MPPCRALYVRNLPFNISAEEVRDYVVECAQAFDAGKRSFWCM